MGGKEIFRENFKNFFGESSDVLKHEKHEHIDIYEKLLKIVRFFGFFGFFVFFVVKNLWRTSSATR